MRHPGDKTQAATANSACTSRGRRGFAGRRDATRELRGGGAALRGRDGGGRRELRARTREGAHRDSKSKQRPADSSDLRPVSSSSRRRPHLALLCSGLVQLQSNPCSCIPFYFFLSERESGSNTNHLIYPYRITRIALIWPRLTARHGGGIDDGARPCDSSAPNGSSLLLL